VERRLELARPGVVAVAGGEREERFWAGWRRALAL
jgi:hypothetical protein